MVIKDKDIFEVQYIFTIFLLIYNVTSKSCKELKLFVSNVKLFLQLKLGMVGHDELSIVYCVLY